jgi:hypothetical protein
MNSNILTKKQIILSQNKSLYYFLNFEDEPLMSCRLCHFSSGKGENIREKFYVFEFAAKLLGGPPFYPIGSLVEL